MAADHYEVLGVRPDASPQEIRTAYRALARRHHPDTQAGAGPEIVERARRRMAALNEAWAVLGDPARRRAYDAGLGVSGPRPPDAGANRRAADWHPFHEELDDDDLDDRPFGDPRPPRPGDSMVMAPVLLVLAAAGLFFLSTMVQSAGMRTLAILLLPVAGLGFVAAPLFVMVRGRPKPPSPEGGRRPPGRASPERPG